jgi:hypothetical protein
VEEKVRVPATRPSAGPQKRLSAIGEDVTTSMSEDPTGEALIQIENVFSELEKSRIASKLRRESPPGCQRSSKKAARSRKLPMQSSF